MLDTMLQRDVSEFIGHLSVSDQKCILLAQQKAIEWHDGQMRQSGEPYVTHCIAVAIKLAELGARKDTLVAALLHDVVEDERATLEEVTDIFGDKVAELVDGVTKLSKLKYEGQRAKRQIASLRKLLLTAHDDLRVILIKLADRWHNIQTIGSLRPDKQERIAKETLEIYVPFARVLGLWDLKIELENACFPLVHTGVYNEWSSEVKQARLQFEPERQECIKVCKSVLKDVDVSISEMTLYELYQKLQGNIDALRESDKVDSIRITLRSRSGDSTLECYKVLGEIHKHFSALSGSFKDYINSPQPNGYHALHTTVFLSKNHLVRLRIQAKDMFDYSNKRKISDWSIDPEGSLKNALSSLSMSSATDDHYLEDVKNAVLSKRISVFTSMGEVVSLPKHATGVDFAFAINPDSIRTLNGVVVNGESREPTYELSDGDTVEIVLLTNGNQNGHKRLWLEKAKSVEAKESIKKSIKHTPQEQRQEQARKILEQELQKMKLPARPLFNGSALQREVVSLLERSSFTELLDQLATGVLSVSEVLRAYQSVIVDSNNLQVRLMNFFRLLPRSRRLDKEALFASIEVHAKDRPGLIHDITKCFAQRDINIAKFGVFAAPNGMALYEISLEVPKFKDFSDLYDSILQVPSVLRVLRKK